MENGDVVDRINDLPLGHSNPDRVFEAYELVKKASYAEVELLRSGQPITIRIEFSAAP